jgi:isopropylmalate/homocitrate/citramalate synthase
MDKPEVFSADDLARIRGGLAQMRVPGAYEPGMWNVSKYTRDPRIAGDAMPKSVILRDITLRVSEQISGVFVTDEDRLRFMRAIAETGIPSIEPAAFRRGHDEEFMRREAQLIREINPKCELVYGAVSSEKDVQLAAETGYDVVQVWSSFIGDAAPSCAGAVYHRAWQGRDWHDLGFPKRPEDQVARSLKYMDLAEKYGIKIGGSVNLLSMADESYVDLYCRTVYEAGCREITLADGAGGASPEVFAHLVKVAREAAPGALIGVHAHDNFGLAIASVIASVKAGAHLVEVSVNGYEEHPGNPDFAITTMALQAVYGVDTQIDTTKLWGLARLGEEVTGCYLARNHPVTGLSVYDGAGGDEYVQQHAVDPLIHSSITPQAVGGRRQESIGLTTGPFTMWDKLSELGIEVDSKQQVELILAEAKALLKREQRELTDADIHAVAAGVTAG